MYLFDGNNSSTKINFVQNGLYLVKCILYTSLPGIHTPIPLCTLFVTLKCHSSFHIQQKHIICPTERTHNLFFPDFSSKNFIYSV